MVDSTWVTQHPDHLPLPLGLVSLFWCPTAIKLGPATYFCLVPGSLQQSSSLTPPLPAQGPPPTHITAPPLLPLLPSLTFISKPPSTPV